MDDLSMVPIEALHSVEMDRDRLLEEKEGVLLFLRMLNLDVTRVIGDSYVPPHNVAISIVIRAETLLKLRELLS